MESTVNEAKSLAKYLANLLMLLAVISVLVSVFMVGIRYLNRQADNTVTVVDTMVTAKLDALCDLTLEGRSVTVASAASALLELRELDLAYISFSEHGVMTYYAYDNTMISGAVAGSVHYSGAPFEEAAQALLDMSGRNCYVSKTTFDGATAIAIILA